MARHGTALRFAALALLLGAPAAAQVDLDTVRAGRYDFGRMWTFEYPATDYFAETYGFRPDQAWFERARMAALRVQGCSASFVSPDGLVVTNHHCIRSRVAQLSRPGENLLDNGFYATSLAEERPIPGYYADQLLSAEDVSAEMFAAIDRATDEAGRARARQTAARAIQDRLRQRHSGDSIVVQVVALYNGGRYSAYTFRRYTDVRMVAAAELQLGFFGGDPDNFTYPRYALDFGFLRVYRDGKPLRTENFFHWSPEGVEENDLVFVIGNPGATSRLLTTPQLQYRREVVLPPLERAYDARIRAIWDFYREDPKAADALDLRNAAFGLSNTWKQYVGQMEALDDPVIMAKKRDAERQLQDSLEAKPALRQRYGTVFQQIAALQPRNRELAYLFGAFTLWGNRTHEAPLMRRAILAEQLLAAQAANAPADTIAAIRQRLLGVADVPRGLERRQLSARLQDFAATFPPDHPVRRAALGNAAVEAAADRLLAQSALATAAGTARALEQNTLRSDPAVMIAAAAAPLHAELVAKQQEIGLLETDLAAQLGRARFEVYGTKVPPDGSSSPRIADGVVKGYEYNGTLAPPYTTFFGMYDRYYAHGADTDWDLPARWVPVPPALDLNTPLNFISTADTYGGNSGSPAVTRDLRLVGLNFDRNIEGLSRNFISLPERGRNIMVDVRAIREALDDVYDADRIVLELMTHKLYATEAEADAVKK